VAGELAGYQARLAAAPRHESALAAMNREYEIAKGQQQALADQLRAARLQGAREGSFRELEPPRVPTAPIAPRRARIVLMGLLAGLGAGLALAFLAQQGDTSFRTMEDFAAPSLPVLAEIPTIGGRPGRRLLAENASPTALSRLIAPNSPAAEQFRILAAKLARRNGPQRPLSLLVTSAGPGEGKTVASVNIALALAQMVEQPVLLVDADLGRPTVHRLLQLPGAPGLGELLTQPDADPARFVRSHQALQVLPAGRFSHESRNALASAAGERVFSRLRQRYAYVVIDAPPILAVAEGLILQRVVDSIALVVRAGATPRHLVERALQNLDASRVVGVILNDVDTSPAMYAYPYYDTPEAVGGGSAG
jgi:tyrosine-protein kinase Etk/Wzc